MVLLNRKKKRKTVAHKQPPKNQREGFDSEPESVGPSRASKQSGSSTTHPYSRYGYSIFAILIFVVGMYSGVKFWPSTQSSTDINSTQSVQAFRNIIPPPQPEDYFPVAEFRKQAAILLGCHNQINLIPELYGEIAKALNGKVALFGIVSNEVQAKSGIQMIKNLGLPESAMRFLIIPTNSIWIRDYAPFILRYDQDSAIYG